MQTQSKVLKWSLIIGIVLVVNLFFNYTLSLVYQEPEYEDYFPQSQVIAQITDKEECLKVGGQWNENVGWAEVYGKPVPAPKGYCDPNFTKQQEFSDARKSYDRNVFVTLVLLGAVCVVIGNFLKTNLVVGIALSLAGVLSFIIASMRYWGSADNLVKVIILAIALGILIWLAIKKFGNNASSGEVQ